MLGRRPLEMNMSGEHVDQWIHILKCLNQHNRKIGCEIPDEYIWQLEYIQKMWIPLSDEEKDRWFSH